MPVRRIDHARLDKSRRTDEGFLVADAQLTRTGVFEYQRADGSLQRELRLAEEVFHPDALASFDLKPLTHRHPPANLDATTARQYAIGVVSSPRKADDGEHVAARVAIHDADTVRAVEAGERELSCGYACELLPVPGGLHRHPDGREDRADYYQRAIRGTHVAVLTKGRAGPTAAIRLDAAGHALGSDAGDQTRGSPRKDQTMEKITIGGTEFEVTPELEKAL